MTSFFLPLGLATLLIVGCGNDAAQFSFGGGNPNPSPGTSPTSSPTPTPNGIGLESLDSNQAQGGGGTPHLNATGGVVVFESFDFGSNPLGDSFARDRAAGTLTLLSQTAAGVQANGGSVEVKSDAAGRFVSFQSAATNLAPGDTNATIDIFRKDRTTGALLRLNVSSGGAEANAFSGNAWISGDGNLVCFESLATNLVAGDTNGVDDIFLRNITAGTTVRLSTDGAGVQGNQLSFGSTISGDGSTVAFASNATNLVAGDTNGVADVFLKNVQTGAVSVASLGLGGLPGNGPVQRFLLADGISLSATGRFVAFSSQATNLVVGDTNGIEDVFVRDMVAGTTRLVSQSTGGVLSNAASDYPSISGDGRFVAFQTAATNLDGGAALTGGFINTYLYDTQTNRCQRLSVALSGAALNNFAGTPAISQDGSRIVFSGTASNLVAGDNNNRQDVFSIANPLLP